MVQFRYAGGYPKKRQWALDHLDIETEWVLLVDADEIVPPALWQEIAGSIADPGCADAYLITKGFHFLGRRFRFGGFSHDAILLFRAGKARFENLGDDLPSDLDMEVHERLLTGGRIGRLRTPLIHEDFKGLEAYIDRHNRYSTWEAHLRNRFLTTGRWGDEPIRANVFGNVQERRRFLKLVAMHVPFESQLWFVYHYLVRFGLLEGRAGLIASRIRAHHFFQVRAKLFELRKESGKRSVSTRAVAPALQGQARSRSAH